MAGQTRMDSIFRDIASVRIQGASQVRKAALDAMLFSADQSKAKTKAAFLKELKQTGLRLAKIRPTEPGLRTVIRIVIRQAEKAGNVNEAKEAIFNQAKVYEQNRKKSLEMIGQTGAQMIPKHSVMLTHCHSHTVEAILVAAKKKIDLVYCTETRPLFQGRLTAANLSKAGLDAVSIVDSASFSFLKECDFFWTGADAVLANGNVVNKIGTGLISLAANRFGTPHFVATSSFAFEPLNFFGFPEPIEQRGFKEVWDRKPQRVSVQNPAFDITEAEWIQGIVCEKGVFSASGFAEEMIKEMDLVHKRSVFEQELPK